MPWFSAYTGKNQKEQGAVWQNLFPFCLRETPGEAPAALRAAGASPGAAAARSAYVARATPQLPLPKALPAPSTKKPKKLAKTLEKMFAAVYNVFETIKAGREVLVTPHSPMQENYPPTQLEIKRHAHYTILFLILQEQKYKSLCVLILAVQEFTCAVFCLGGKTLGGKNRGPRGEVPLRILRDNKEENKHENARF